MPTVGPPHEPSAPENRWRFRHEAMATTFEILVSPGDPDYAAQAAQAAFGVLDQLEQRLSRYIENSDVSRVNARAEHEPVPVAPDTFACLKRALELRESTGGAFDITVGELTRPRLGTAASPPAAPATDAGSTMVKPQRKLILRRRQRTVRFASSGFSLDLGGIGKGYALDQMATVLHEWDIDHALLHGGHSTLLGLGSSPPQSGWPVVLRQPHPSYAGISRITLREQALGASARKDRSPIVDPATGRPVEDKLAAWSLAPDATTADALSTAFMVMSEAAIRSFHAQHPGVGALLAYDPTGDRRDPVVRIGWPR